MHTTLRHALLCIDRANKSKTVTQNKVSRGGHKIERYHFSPVSVLSGGKDSLYKAQCAQTKSCEVILLSDLCLQVNMSIFLFSLLIK